MLVIGLNPRDIVPFELIKQLESSPHRTIYVEQVKKLMGGHCYFCFREEDTPVLEIVKRRYGIDLQVSLPPVKHRLNRGDQVIIILVNNIRRIGEGEAYTREEIRKARITFRLYTIDH